MASVETSQDQWSRGTGPPPHAPSPADILHFALLALLRHGQSFPNILLVSFFKCFQIHAHNHSTATLGYLPERENTPQNHNLKIARKIHKENRINVGSAKCLPRTRHSSSSLSFSCPEPSDRSPSRRSERHRGETESSAGPHTHARPGGCRDIGPKPQDGQCLISRDRVIMPGCGRGGLTHSPARMWLREASILSMKEAGTVMVLRVSSSMSSLRVMT